MPGFSALQMGVAPGAQAGAAYGQGLHQTMANILQTYAQLALMRERMQGENYGKDREYALREKELEQRGASERERLGLAREQMGQQGQLKGRELDISQKQVEGRLTLKTDQMRFTREQLAQTQAQFDRVQTEKEQARQVGDNQTWAKLDAEERRLGQELDVKKAGLAEATRHAKALEGLESTKVQQAGTKLQQDYGLAKEHLEQQKRTALAAATQALNQGNLQLYQQAMAAFVELNKLNPDPNRPMSERLKGLPQAPQLAVDPALTGGGMKGLTNYTPTPAPAGNAGSGPGYGNPQTPSARVEEATKVLDEAKKSVEAANLEGSGSFFQSRIWPILGGLPFGAVGTPGLWTLQNRNRREDLGTALKEQLVPRVQRGELTPDAAARIMATGLIRGGPGFESFNSWVYNKPQRLQEFTDYFAGFAPGAKPSGEPAISVPEATSGGGLAGLSEYNDKDFNFLNSLR